MVVFQVNLGQPGPLLPSILEQILWGYVQLLFYMAVVLSAAQPSLPKHSREHKALLLWSGLASSFYHPLLYSCTPHRRCNLVKVSKKNKSSSSNGSNIVCEQYILNSCVICILQNAYLCESMTRTVIHSFIVSKYCIIHDSFKIMQDFCQYKVNW